MLDNNYVENDSVAFKKRIFFIMDPHFSTFLRFSPLWIISAIHICLPIRELCDKYGWDWLSGLREVQNVYIFWKFTDGHTDDGQNVLKILIKNEAELKLKKNYWYDFFY